MTEDTAQAQAGGNGALVPYSQKKTDELRQEMKVLRDKNYTEVDNNLKWAMHNLPRSLLNKEVHDGVTIADLPELFSQVDSYFRQAIYAINKTPGLTPDDIELVKLKHAFVTLGFIQEKLDDIVEYHGAHNNGAGRYTQATARWKEAEQDDKPKVNAFELGANLSGSPKPKRELSSTEKATFEALALGVSRYASANAHLLGIKINSSKLVPQEGGSFTFEHDEAAVREVSPPQAWMDGIGNFVIRMPSSQLLSYTFGNSSEHAHG